MNDRDFIRALDGVREQAGWFVDGDDVGVFEKNFEGHLNRAGRRFAGRGQGDFDVVARVEDRAAIGGLAVYFHHAEVEGFLDA